jgi:hypothetical protein
MDFFRNIFEKKKVDVLADCRTLTKKRKKHPNPTDKAPGKHKDKTC